MALISVQNRQAPAQRASVIPHVGNETNDSWYNITAKKKSNEVVAEVYIYDEIGYWGVTAQQFIKDLTALDATQINLHINSPGGDVFDGVAIYNALRMHSAKVTVYVDSLAASAASFIAQAGDEVVILRNGTMMIHDASAIAWGNEEEMRNTADLLGRVSDNIADIYSQRAGGSLEEWRAIMKAEMWYNADEAVEAGLADRVLDLKDEDADEATNAWDLHVFNFAGRENAPDPLERMQKIKNQAKEAPVGRSTGTTPRNAEENPPVEDDEEDDDQTTEDVEESEDEESESPETDESEGDEDEDEEPKNKGKKVSAKAGAFLVNGVQVTDPKAVQAHITLLENAMKESREANRNEFVQNLAKENKIHASQIDQFEKLVATFSDEQYTQWAALWDTAPAVGTLGEQGAQNGGIKAETAANEDDLQVAKGIVQQHVMSNMPIDKIKSTGSYKKVVAADPNFKLPGE